MDQNDVIEYISSIPVGTVVAWIMVIAAIIGAICVAVVKLYKVFESYHKTKDENDALRKMVQSHDDCLTKILEKLDDIQEDMKKREASDFKKLRHSIVRAGEEAVTNEVISIRALKSLEELYTDYHDNKHGNSYVTTLMKKVRLLPVNGKLDEEGNDIE